ncbi:MAG: S8 family serine peptidase [Aeromicrobium sp.]|uniref:S8 family serine peptidase n=1 Tax=Aeromicrobium sp. TaxID=1871063 RepID=UPI003C371912
MKSLLVVIVSALLLALVPAAASPSPDPRPEDFLGATTDPRDASPAVGIIATARDTAPPSVLAAVSTIVGRQVVGQTKLGGSMIAMRFSEPHTVAEIKKVAKRLEALPGIDSVSPDLLVQTDNLPNDTYFSRQVNVFSSIGPDATGTPQVYSIDAPSLWRATTGLKSVVVAVLDGGLVSHTDVTGQKIAGYDMIADKRYAGDGSGRDSNPADPGNYSSGTYCTASKSSWHGTHVSGIISALRNNGKGIAGVAPGAALQPVRVVGRCVTSMSDVIAGIRWASGGRVPGVPDSKTRAKVLNLSLSSTVSDFTCPAAYQEVIDEARARGALAVASAGNQSESVRTRTPANCSGVLSVGAVAPDGSPTTYTNVGGTLGMVAPGGVDPKVQPDQGIWSTVDRGAKGPDGSTYKQMSGTSMAAPAVSAAAALVFSLGTFTPDEVIQVLKASAVRPPKIDGYYTCLSDDAAGNERNVCGAGILNLAEIPAPITRPTISGSPAVGSSLTLTPGTWNGAPTVSHAWLRGGTPIAGATGPTYTVVADDFGQVLSVRSTARADGYPDFTSTSSALSVGRSASEPSGISPEHYPDTGNLYTEPSTFTEGQLVKMAANFPDGVFNVVLYEETAPGVWTSVATDESNKSGNAYFLNYRVTGTQRVFALTSRGTRTEVDTLTPTS